MLQLPAGGDERMMDRWITKRIRVDASLYAYGLVLTPAVWPNSVSVSDGVLRPNQSASGKPIQIEQNHSFRRQYAFPLCHSGCELKSRSYSVENRKHVNAIS